MADAIETAAGEVTQDPVKEKKLISWVVSLVPDAVKCPNAEEALIYVTNELAKLRKSAPAAGTAASSSDVLESLKRIEASLKTMKENQSMINQRLFSRGA